MSVMFTSIDVKDLSLNCHVVLFSQFGKLSNWVCMPVCAFAMRKIRFALLR